VASRRIGIFCLPGRGHLYPAIALGKRLKERGHHVIVFNRNITRGLVKNSGLAFCSIQYGTVAPGPYPESLASGIGPNTLNVIYEHSCFVLRGAYEAALNAKVDCLLVDQGDVATGSIADTLRIPFISLAMFPPVYLGDDTPPFISRWKPGVSPCMRRRNKRGNDIMRRLLLPLLHLVNEWRQSRGLRPILDINEAFSKHAIITQVPDIFDFPRTPKPAHLFYTGPFPPDRFGPAVGFPWDKLNGKPLVYVTLGTVRNSAELFSIIASACSRFELQVVISLGGMQLTPDDLHNLPGSPLVVHFAPQSEVMKRAALTICHGGINTVLGSISSGVPVIVIPITDDQPGVGARVEWTGAGLMLPLRRLSCARLEQCIAALLGNPEYRSRTGTMSAAIHRRDGLNEAAEIVERVLSTSPAG
jgi:zeaxanthin glucosyltransferase